MTFRPPAWRTRSRVPRLFFLLFATPAFAHMMSMSTGDLLVEGARARYELRMPLYEIAHMKDAAPSLLAHIRFSSAGKQARLLTSNCRTDPAAATYFCTAEFDFGAPPDRVDAECSFHRVTVPNHVHLLRAEMAGKRDQALLDASFSRASLRFTPPSAIETALTQAGAGFMRALGGAVQILFLAALVIASRSRRELATLAAMFVAGQVLAVALVPLTGWQPAPRFVEAAAALTVAYLAVEVLLLPGAGARWAVAAVLGAFHGLYFHLLLQQTEYRAALVLSGAALAEVAAIALLGLCFARIGRWTRALRPVQVSASALLVFGMVWFVMRLRG
jgi:hypothetical protein